MKNIFIIVTLFLLVFAANQSKAVAPTFNLSAKNFTTFPVGDQDSILEFDVYMQWTNSGTSDPCLYGAGQYFLNYNTGITAGALTLSSVGSDLPPAYQNPTFLVAAGRLQVSTNLPTPPGFLISDVFPGTKIIRLRLRTSSHVFNTVPTSIFWRIPPGTNPVTKVAYFDPTGLLVDYTAGGTFFTDSNFVSPVELASFTSSTNRNNVTLNWATTRETNNQGFDIQRKTSGSDWATVGNVAGFGNSTETHNYSFTERINTGNYSYRLHQKDFNGNTQDFNLSSEVIVGIPSTYSISQNYPNPFNPSTKIDYDLPFTGKVSILLYDISGREVGNLVNEVKDAGYYTVKFNASNLASGMYFYRITAQGNNQNFVSTKKMVLIK